MENRSLTKPNDKIARISEVMAKNKPNIEALIPEAMRKHMTPERITKIVLAAASRTPKLLECSPISILKACMTATQLGLECDGILGGAYLVPYWNSKERTLEAQFICGYKGLLTLARRSGEISSIEAHIVRSGDRFRCQFGLEQILEHEPDWSAKEQGDPIAAYAVARFKDGGHHIEVMTVAEIEKIRNMSKAGNAGPWKDHWEQMARKTVLRRICNYLPLSVEYREAIEAEHAVEADKDISATEQISAYLGKAIDAESHSEPSLPGDDRGGTDGDLSAVFYSGSAGPVVHGDPGDS